MRKKTFKLSPRASINQLKIDALPYFTFAGAESIIPYGKDNLYPYRLIKAIDKSPTALGCVKRTSEFIFGLGVAKYGDVVVNRDGETLNEVVWQVIRHGYSPLGGCALHLNFNIFGQISEIFCVDIQHIRKSRDLCRVEYGIWSIHNRFMNQFIPVDSYGKKDPIKGIKEEGLSYKGQVLYWSKDSEIYPTSPLDSAVISAEFEREAQIYPLSNIRNGFSGNTVIKMPTIAQGENAQKEADDLTAEISKLHGADRSGSSLVVPMQVSTSGEIKPFQMIEHFSPTNIDTLFVNQNNKAESDILKVYGMPKILLGIPDQGMFNAASYADAFNYKVADTESDRRQIEGIFNKILPNSVFGIYKIELIPSPKIQAT